MRETCKTRFQLKATILSVATLTLVMLAVVVTTIISHAEEGKVVASSAIIRASADVNSNMVGGAQQGEIVTINGEVTGADGYTWYQVTFGETSGYMRSTLLEKVGGGGAATTTPTGTTPASSPATEVTALQPITARVKGEEVRVRSNASTSGTIVTTVKRDVVLTVVGKAVDSESKTWYQVNFSDANGQVTGYIREDYVTLEGEVVPADQVPETPVDPPVDPVVPEPADPEPAHKDYETKLYDEDGWNLLDYTQEPPVRYPISELIDTANSALEKQKLYEDSQATIKTTKFIMIILVVLVIVLALAATLLFFKIRDMMDAAYFEEVEKETIRRRQGSAGRTSMPTVGAGNRSAGSASQKTSGAGQQRPSGSSQSRSAGNSQQKSSGSSQSRPAGSSQQRPSGSSQSRPAGSQPRPSGSGQAKPRPAGNGGQKPSGSGQAKPVGQQQSRPVSREAQNVPKQSKNFMADDDEFDFEYLNWDGEEDN